MGPLKTRSLPGALWEKVPSEFQQWEENLRSQVFDYCVRWTPFWKVFKFFSENPWGITITLSTLFLILVIVWRKEVKGSRWAWIKNKLIAVLTMLVLIGLSDIVSNQMKVWVGRLKPHVTFYNPNILPALSFPSNHAFNSLLAVLLIALCWDFSSQRQKRVFGIVGGFIVVFVGFSRVAMGQHYFSDVLAGWFLAFVSAFLLKNIYKKILWRFIKYQKSP